MVTSQDEIHRWSRSLFGKYFLTIPLLLTLGMSDSHSHLNHSDELAVGSWLQESIVNDEGKQQIQQVRWLTQQTTNWHARRRSSPFDASFIGRGNVTNRIDRALTCSVAVSAAATSSAELRSGQRVLQRGLGELLSLFFESWQDDCRVNNSQQMFNVFSLLL